MAFKTSYYSFSEKYFGQSMPAKAKDIQTQVWTPFYESL
jgi:hypothetical protein